MRTLLIISILTSYLLLPGCQKDLSDDNVVFEKVPALNIQIPEEMTRGQETEIHFDYPLYNGCYNFSRVDISSSEEQINYITVFVEHHQNTHCTQDYTEESYTLTFIPENAGNFILKFWVGRDNQGNDIWDDYQIIVNE
jgi:hypothetical protein